MRCNWSNELKMQKFVRGESELLYNTQKREEIIADALKTFPGMTREMVEKQLDIVQNDELWLNDLYQVNLRVLSKTYHGSRVVWLSIKRRDKEPCHDWRDFQEIKNQLVGPECEGVELYPAESRVVDTSNQYHLFVIADRNFRWPFGFREGFVTYTGSRHSKQRKKAEGG